jgi:hypothetical protein
MGDEKADSQKAPTMPLDMTGKGGALPDEFDKVLKEVGVRSDTEKFDDVLKKFDVPRDADAHDKTGSPNQPGLSPSEKLQTQHDRIKEQVDGDPPNEREENKGEPEDPIPPNPMDQVEDGISKTLDTADQIQRAQREQQQTPGDRAMSTPDTVGQSAPDTDGQGLTQESSNTNLGADVNAGFDADTGGFSGMADPVDNAADFGANTFSDDTGSWDGGGDFADGGGGDFADSGFEGGADGGGEFADSGFEGGADGGGEFADSGFEGGADGGGEFADSGGGDFFE